MIVGEKIRLRPLERDDLARSVTWINDPEVRHGVSMYMPISMEEEVKWYETMIQSDRYERAQAIDARTDVGWQHIGSMGFHTIDWRSRHAEFGIMIGDKDFWSRGYGTDAVKTWVKFGFEMLNLQKVWLRVFEYNARAIRCYEKAGFVREGRLRRDHFLQGQYYDTLLMGILREEWSTTHTPTPPPFASAAPQMEKGPGEG